MRELQATNSRSGESWFETYEGTLSCAWRLNPIGQAETIGREVFGDFFSGTSQAGFNLGLAVTVERYEGQEPPLSESILRKLTDCWDHAVLNQVYASQVSEDEPLSVERLAMLMWADLKIKLPQTLRAVVLGVTREWSAKVFSSQEPKIVLCYQLPLRTALRSKRGGLPSLIPFAGNLKCFFSGPLDGVHKIILPYGRIENLAMELARATHSQPLNAYLSEEDVDNVLPSLFVFLKSRAPELIGLEFTDSLTKITNQSFETELQVF
jgi:hypothetical protein